MTDDMTTTTALPQMDFADTITTTTTATTTTAETTTIYTTTTSVDISDLARGDFENEGKNTKYIVSLCHQIIVMIFLF